MSNMELKREKAINTDILHEAGMDFIKKTIKNPEILNKSNDALMKDIEQLIKNKKNK